MISINVNLPEHQSAKSSTIQAFLGRGDVIPKDDLEDHGIVLYRSELNTYFEKEELKELFDLTTLLEGTAQPKMVPVSNATGEVRMVAEPKQASRRLRIRK